MLISGYMTKNKHLSVYVDFLKEINYSIKTCGDVVGGVDHQIYHLQIHPQIQTEVIFCFV